ncbi:MAG: hypothetical protein JWR80_5680 [Bradyrhizobium sp.]|nr:hypothetical protein [Bradyrhizobium sp.]
MYLLATAKFIDRSKIAALVKHEMEKVRALEREGVVLSTYRRSDGEGVVAIMQVDSVEQARARTGELPFVRNGVLAFEFAEIEPL